MPMPQGLRAFSRKPCRIDRKNVGKKPHHVAPGNGLAAYILAHLAFSQPLAALRGCTDEVCLLEPGIGHGLLKTLRKRWCHGAPLPKRCHLERGVVTVRRARPARWFNFYRKLNFQACSELNVQFSRQYSTTAHPV